jgi:TRAP-type C4-dicarboxylate transport system permease small subunit
MKPDKAPGYWPTRFLLALAIIATIAVAFALWSADWASPTFGGNRPSVLGLPSNVVLFVLAAATAVIGLIWTIRTFRGPRDEPPPWRYRDR